MNLLFFKIYGDGLIRRCVPDDEILGVLMHCHSLECGGHTSSTKTTAKVLQSSFFWPSLFKDAKEFVLKCDRCQRTGNISRHNEMPLINIIKIELFDV